MDLGVYLVNMVLRESVSRFFHPFRPEISILVSVKCFKGKRENEDSEFITFNDFL